SMSRLMPHKDDDPSQLSRSATCSRSSEHQGKTTHMNSNPTSGQISRSTTGQVEPEHVAPDGLSAEMSNLRRDVASLKDTFARLASQVGGEVAKTARSMSQTVALARADRTRVPELVPVRYERMLTNPFAFLRGAAAVMAEDLRHQPTAGIPIQACGDCHLMNFGAFA